MKTTLTEHEGCFAIEFEAETIQDAATLVRLGTLGTKEVRHISAIASKNGAFSSCVVVGKARNPEPYIPRSR